MLTEETRARIVAELTKYPQRRSAVLPALRYAQEEAGYLSEEVLAEVGALVDVDPNALGMLATFYDLLYVEPVGKRVISVCDGLACHLNGSGEVIDALLEQLGIALDGVTADGAFTVKRMECLAACHIAPCALINGEEYVGLLRPEDVPRLIEQLRPTGAGRRVQLAEWPTPFPPRQPMVDAGAAAATAPVADDSTGAGRESR